MENSVFQVILKKTDIVKIISAFIKLEPKGKSFVGLCPFHQDVHPSLSVSSDKQIYKCFSCGASGNAITFVKNFKKISWVEAAKKVAEMSGFSESEIKKMFKDTIISEEEQRILDLNKTVSMYYNNVLLDSNNAFALEYLNKRKIDNEIIRKYQIGFAPKHDDNLYKILTNKDNFMGENRDKDLIWSDSQLIESGNFVINESGSINEFFYNRIMIPICDSWGNVVGFSGRTLDKNNDVKYMNTKDSKIFNKSKLLFNYNFMINNDYEELYLVEGYFDCFALVRNNHDNVVATMGTSLTKDQIGLIKSAGIKKVILAFDNDTAGKKFRNENAIKLLQSGLSVSILDYKGVQFKDVDEMSLNLTNDEFQNLLNKHVDFISWLINEEWNNNLSIEEKTKVIANIVKIISYSSPASQAIYLNELSKIIGIEVAELRSLLKKHSFEQFKKESQIINEEKKSKDFMMAFQSNDRKMQTYEKKIERSLFVLVGALINNGHLIEYYYNNHLIMFPKKYQEYETFIAFLYNCWLNKDEINKNNLNDLISKINDEILKESIVKTSNKVLLFLESNKSLISVNNFDKDKLKMLIGKIKSIIKHINIINESRKN